MAQTASTHQRLSYEEAVAWLRSQQQYTERVRGAYLGADVEAAAHRFARSAEFAELRSWALHYSLNPGVRILDLGAGNGIASYAWAEVGFAVTAADPDPSVDVGCGAIRRLQAATTPMMILQASGEALPLQSEQFDLVYVRQVLHHAANLGQMLREIARVLRPGGYLFATREHVANDQQELETFLSRHPLHHLTGAEMAYPLETYRAAIQRAGLRVLRVFKPLDTVVNYYSMTAFEVHQLLMASAPRRLSAGLNKIIGESAIWQSYLRSLNARSGPGRLFSFVARKPSSRVGRLRVRAQTLIMKT